MKGVSGGRVEGGRDERDEEGCERQRGSKRWMRRQAGALICTSVTGVCVCVYSTCMVCPGSRVKESYSLKMARGLASTALITHVKAITPKHTSLRILVSRWYTIHLKHITTHAHTCLCETALHSRSNLKITE